MVVSKRDRRLTRHDWAEAALRAIAAGGIEAVAVEPIAAKLGTTKGSFYWHFKNRDSLVEAALELWERRRTDAVIEFLDTLPGPAERLRTLIEIAYEQGPSDRIEIALLSNPNNRIAVRTVRRVAERRLDYLTDQLEALGWDAGEARFRAFLIGYVYIGRIQMAHVMPRVDAADRQRHAELVFSTLVSGAVSPSGVERVDV